MAQIFPEELSSFSKLSSSSRTVYRLLEQNLSDEWECHAAFSGNNIDRFIIISPDLGVLVLCISNCSSDQFDSFFYNIPQIQQQHLDAVRQQLQKENQLCNEDKSLKFPVGFGLIFTELSSDYANSAEVGKLSGFALFSDELRDMIYSPADLETRLFDMVEENDFYELDDVELQLISNNIPLIHNVLQGEDNDGNIKQSGTDREKNLLVDENPEPQKEGYIEDGDQDMDENRGIEPFINHLDFLGYECTETESEVGSDLKTYICAHPYKLDIVLVPADKLDVIMVACNLSFEESKIANKKSELLKTINELNELKPLTCCFLSKTNSVIVRAQLSIQYSKIAFGVFIESFHQIIDEIYNPITEILQEKNEKTVTKEDYIPF